MQCPQPIAINDLLVPCNHCQVCRTNKMSDWIVRLTHEKQNSMYTYFLTLTYSEANLPLNDEGESMLAKRDLQLWFKRLRKSKNFRYYAVGEYGTKHGRAHYHAIIFSQVPISYEHFNKSWGLGFVHIGTVTPQSIQYVSKYVFNEKGQAKGRTPNFALVSRKPGIGNNAIQRLPHRNYLYLNGYKKRLPRYYKDKLFTKQQKQAMREKTIEEVNRLYLATLEKLRLLGYENPWYEYDKRQRHQATNKIKTDNSRLKF